MRSAIFSKTKFTAWDDPIGKKFVFGGGDGPDVERRVVGVVKDYHQNSLYEAIEPLMIMLSDQNYFVFVRTTEGDVRQSLTAVENVWKDMFPNNTFSMISSIRILIRNTQRMRNAV